MDPTYLIGIDVGSSFIKAAIFDLEGKVVGETTVDNHPHQPRPGVAEYDAAAMLRAVLDALRQLVDATQIRPGAVAALAVDGMQSGMLGVDAESLPATPYTTTLDLRFAPQLNEVMAHHHDRIRALTGAGQPTFAPKIRWLQQEFPELVRRTHKFVTIGDYLTARLAGLDGRAAFIGRSYLWMTGLSDTLRGAWSEELCTAMEIPLDKLPRIVPSSAVIGGLSPAAATVCRLSAGTPIVAGCGDQVAGFIGAGITRPGRAGDVAGTYPVIAICTDGFRPDLIHQRTEILPSAIPGRFNPISFINGGGLTHHWFGRLFGGSGAGNVELDAAALYRTIDAEAGHIPPGADRLLFNPHLGGRACPTVTHLRGLWIGFTWTHTRAHFYRALLEAVAYDHCEALSSLTATYPESTIDEITVYGGGARSALWNQIKADVLGIPYVNLGRDDLGALGVAILAGHGVGLFPDLAETAARFVRPVGRCEPDPDRHRFYRAYVDAYRSLLSQAGPLYRALAELPEWPPA